MANETPNTSVRTPFIETLAGRARALDPTRLITATLLVRAEGNTKIVVIPWARRSMSSVTNERLGWYEGIQRCRYNEWKSRAPKAADDSEFAPEPKPDCMARRPTLDKMSSGAIVTNCPC